MNGRVYTVSQSAAAVTAAMDLSEILVPTGGLIELQRILFGQSSDYGDAQAEGLSLAIVRATGTSGSGGSSFTPKKALTGDAASGCTCEVLNTTKATTREILVADAINVQAGGLWLPSVSGQFRFRAAEFCCLELVGAPTDSLTVSFTVEYKELH